MSLDRDQLVALVAGFAVQTRRANALGEAAERDGDWPLADDLYDVAWRMEVASRRLRRVLRTREPEAVA